MFKKLRESEKRDDDGDEDGKERERCLEVLSTIHVTKQPPKFSVITRVSLQACSLSLLLLFQFGGISVI